ncbi:hexapeptide repeat containing transferase like protein [Bacillus phage Bobb]|uniref:Hexapeptide repeat containing transferase like protein n=1 Tax=Bacillus phage Bobb TaxID=1527469 RepID=A0A076GD72_9CAUD|nr:hexapeptide repeat containing transferase like protein [Bacillus phage Bobb]AII27940.1 hexapeptide repeat containing transferase like protein [Bacillus phage Bobb]
MTKKLTLKTRVTFEFATEYLGSDERETFTLEELGFTEADLLEGLIGIAAALDEILEDWVRERTSTGWEVEGFEDGF